MKTGKLTVAREAFVTATQLSVADEESLSHTCYLMVLNIQKATEDVDARMHTLQDKVLLLMHSFKLETSEWSRVLTATLSVSGGYISRQKEIYRH